MNKQPLLERDNVQKRVAIYARVSTDEQAEKGHGLDVQKDILIKRCNDLKYSLEVRHIYVDGGYSGSLQINKRPALKRLFEDAAQKQFDVVLVYRLDRFFRNLKHVINAVEQLTEHKVAFRSATEPFETETINGELMFHLIASFAHHERKLIAERMGKGRERAAKEGRWVTGVPPYGYKVDKTTRTLVEVPEEAEVVRKFYHWLVYEKCSLTEITKRANELNMPAPKHKTIKKRKTHNFWWKRTINRVLVNEVYTGEFYYRKYKRPFKYLDGVLDEEHQRPEEEWIPLNVPPIIDKKLFQAAIKQLQKNRQDSVRNTKRAYMFSKLLHCGYTGLKLQSGYQTPRVHRDSPTLGKYYHTYVPEKR